MTQHTHRDFERELEALRARIAQMAGLVESQLREALAAYREGDAERAENVIAADRDVNELELAIDGELGQLIVRRQPAASDLRLALAASKIVTDLERIGDEAAKVARIAVAASGSPAPDEIVRLAESAIETLRKSLDAFARLDASAAVRACGDDSAIDDQFRAVLASLIAEAPGSSRSIARAIQAIWVAKAFERVGDHARNIAEQVIYVVKGRDVRHIPLSELREALDG